MQKANEFKFDPILSVLSGMLNNRLDNYIVAGLSSQLVGGGDYGKVRLFHADRDTRDAITPHSHRFDFACLVLRGVSINTLYQETKERCDVPWCKSTVDQVCGLDGLRQYTHTRDNEPTYWRTATTRYVAGDVYYMRSQEIHSIQFARDSAVIFFEGPQVTPTGVMIEPWINGKCVPTFKTEPWMFEKA